MSTIYQLMIGKKEIGELYYDEDDAIDNAMQLSNERKENVEFWEAEDVDGVPVDCLEWHLQGRVVYVDNDTLSVDELTDEDLLEVRIGGL